MTLNELLVFFEEIVNESCPYFFFRYDRLKSLIGADVVHRNCNSADWRTRCEQHRSRRHELCAATIISTLCDTLFSPEDEFKTCASQIFGTDPCNTVIAEIRWIVCGRSCTAYDLTKVCNQTRDAVFRIIEEMVIKSRELHL